MVASGKSLWIGGVSLSVLECSGVLGTFFGGTLSDRVGRQTVLAVVMPASAALMLAFIYASDWMIFPILLLLGCTLFAITPVNLAIVQDHSRHCRGTANGLFMGISFITTALVTFLVGLMADQFDLKTAFTVSALFGFAGIPIIFFLPKSCIAAIKVKRQGMPRRYYFRDSWILFYQPRVPHIAQNQIFS